MCFLDRSRTGRPISRRTEQIVRHCICRSTQQVCDRDCIKLPRSKIGGRCISAWPSLHSRANQARLSAASQSFIGSASPVASAAATILASIASRNLGSTKARSAVAISSASAIAAKVSGLNVGMVAPNFALLQHQVVAPEYQMLERRHEGGALDHLFAPAP